MAETHSLASATTHARFWRRFIAWVIDWALVSASASRNVLKIQSAMILFIGCMMAGQTRHKQRCTPFARCYVVVP